jgi:hypothetical protein
MICPHGEYDLAEARDELAASWWTRDWKPPL